MITHLAMNSHPNPENVLVIGGGDGGVLREVVKHDCVKKAVLCDIDEAVIRLSKQFLPAMAVGFEHPKTETIVGDGFKYLEDKKGEFDVIITDSSDPEGPAEALFQKAYFELLNGALREGGVITTQGCKPSPICQSAHALFLQLNQVLSRTPADSHDFSREPMASHASHHQAQERLQGGLS
jgi:spermidine synthase